MSVCTLMQKVKSHKVTTVFKKIKARRAIIIPNGGILFGGNYHN